MAWTQPTQNFFVIDDEVSNNKLGKEGDGDKSVFYDYVWPTMDPKSTSCDISPHGTYRGEYQIGSEALQTRYTHVSPSITYQELRLVSQSRSFVVSRKSKFENGMQKRYFTRNNMFYFLSILTEHKAIILPSV